MRICHISSATLETSHFASLGRGLSEQGLPTLWVALTRQEPPTWIQNLNRAEYCSLDADSRWAWPSAVKRLVRLLRTKHIDVIQTHLFDAGIVGVLAGRIASTPLTVLTRHHMDQIHMVGTRVHVGLDRGMARLAHRVIVPCHAVRDYIVSTDHVSPEKIEVIYYGFDFEMLSATESERRRVRSEFGFSSEFVIGCIASFFPTKGHAYLLEAVKAVLSEIPTLRVLLVGTGDRALVEATIDELQLGDRVVFAGFRRDVAACMAAMDLVVHPSLSEAFCQVIVEAMAVGTPLIATRVAGAPEAVRDGETGTLVPPADSEAIRQAMLGLFRDPERRQRLAIAGRASVRSQFTARRMVDEHVACYRRWLGVPR